jgi:hypothetical protein
MNYIELADEILHYYNRTMSSGHTYTALNGANNNDKALFVGAYHDQRKFVGIDKRQFVTLEDLAKGRLRGTRKPIVFDNFAIASLLAGVKIDYELEIRELEKELNSKGGRW